MREHDARGNGGGFAPLEASCRRVAGVSWLYWCNFPRLVAPSTWAKLNRVPLTAQFPRLVAPSTWAELDHAPLMVQFPPFAGGEVTIRGGVVPKVQTTSARNANNGLARARWSAMWAQQRLASCVARARTAEYAW